LIATIQAADVLPFIFATGMIVKGFHVHSTIAIAKSRKSLRLPWESKGFVPEFRVFSKKLSKSSNPVQGTSKNCEFLRWAPSENAHLPQ